MSDVVDAISALRDEIREMRGDMVSLLAAAKGEREVIKNAIEAIGETVRRIDEHNMAAHDRDGKRIRNVELAIASNKRERDAAAR